MTISKAKAALSFLQDWVGLTGHPGSQNAKNAIQTIREFLDKQDQVTNLDVTDTVSIEAETVSVPSVSEPSKSFTYFKKGRKDA